MKILFATDTYAFRALDEVYGDEDPDDNGAIGTEIHVDCVMWLAEVAQYRQSLSYVRIEEEAGRSPSMRVHRTAALHNAPPRVKEAFHATDIKIELYLRPSLYPSLLRP
ncbi:uncharacterized protein N7482_010467 [Penicillium canariense]|uniref:Uncharacterized protein n=1 Tax=Penicillium canariense TaxID=189055 RepID=A0A9W9HLV8_9EURO|nr:uncharacterized protein N7482_010467 [Penicillium canariense]KAJ5151215.1 hypothetical protein N7482_010467 [Penicillium canariense]